MKVRLRKGMLSGSWLPLLLFVIITSHTFGAEKRVVEKCVKILGSLSTYTDDYLQARSRGKITGRGRLTKRQEEFLQGVVMPLLGRDLLKCNAEGCSAKDFRTWRVSGEMLIFEGFPWPAPQLRIEWTVTSEKPFVSVSGNVRTLVLPEAVADGKTSLKNWIPELFPDWLKGHPLEKEFTAKLSTELGRELLDHLPLGVTSTRRQVDEDLLVAVDMALPGAVSFSELRTPADILHPKLGRIRVVGKSTDNGGTLRIDIGGQSYSYEPQQAKLIYALPQSAAARQLSKNRANAFAPSSHVALLFSTQYLVDLNRNDKIGAPLYERIKKIYLESFPTETGNDFERYIGSLKTDLLYYGIRHDESERLLVHRQKMALLAQKLEEESGLDLVKAGVQSWVPNEGNYYDWPNLHAAPQAPNASRLALPKQVKFQRKDVLDVYLERLSKQGRETLTDNTQIADENDDVHTSEAGRPTFLTIGTKYFTKSHPSNDSDWFSSSLDKLQAFAKSGNIRSAETAAGEIVDTMKGAFGDIDPKQHDLITFVPGSEKRENRAYYLAKATADLLGNGLHQFGTTIARNPHWEGAPQKFQTGVPSRVRNAANKFRVFQEQDIKGKSILLIEDTNTSGVTIENIRRVLLEAGAKKVSVFAFAQTVKDGQKPPSLPTYQGGESEKFNYSAALATLPNEGFVSVSALKDAEHLTKLDAEFTREWGEGVKSPSATQLALRTAKDIGEVFDRHASAIVKIKSLEELNDESRIAELGLTAVQAREIHYRLKQAENYVLNRSRRRAHLDDFLSPSQRFVFEVLIARSSDRTETTEQLAAKFQSQMVQTGSLNLAELSGKQRMALTNQAPQILVATRDPATFKALVKLLYGLDYHER